MNLDTLVTKDFLAARLLSRMLQLIHALPGKIVRLTAIT
jgi:hypothetical protein